MTTKAQLLQQLALLESLNDHLETELHNLDHLMELVGFSGGLATVKATAYEILAKGYHEKDPGDYDLEHEM